MSELKVHPVADLFPMLSDDELAELAADIKQRGLLQPVVLDTKGHVLDGRNRLAACEMAGVEPEFVTYDGDDADGYGLAVNVHRRQLTKGQRAVILVRAQDFSEKNLDGDVAASEITKARAVVLHADLADMVLGLTMSLNDAYHEARRRKQEAEEAKAKHDRLRTNASDLASLVDEERMHLDDAIAALDAREEKARQDAEDARREAEQRASEEERKRRVYEQERQESLERDRDRLRMVITGWPTMRNTILPDPDSEQAKEIIGGLGDGDQEALAKILTEVAG